MRSLLTIFFLTSFFSMLKGQYTMPDALLKNSITEQIKYIKEKTLIYEDYRAIREDMFQKLMANFSDTLSAANARINRLNITVSELKRNVDSLTADLESTKTSLETAVRTKNSFRLFGSEINKLAYNTIMWLTIATLAVILAIVFMSFKRSLTITRTTEKELKDLNDEFQAYRKTAREAREKMSMDHFNELKKLRGG
jgi:tetrahydromethanopterin S-methyltransferase subunit B